MDDERIKNLAGVLGNKTCENIIDYLEKNDEASASDISEALKLPLNTVDYNIKKLVESGVVEKKKKFFWSVKGKKIVTYGLSNKSIVISPKGSSVASKMKSIVPGILGVGIATALVGFFAKPKTVESSNLFTQKAGILEAGGEAAPQVAMDSMKTGVDAVSGASEAMQTAGDAAVGAIDVARDTTINNINIFTEAAPHTPFWVWFMIGALAALFIFSIINWRKL
jgi:DNA-binding transcriptional ArsR family regulator